MAGTLHISISAEPILSIGKLTVTNSLFTSWIVVVLLCLIAVWVYKKIKLIPSTAQLLIEIPIEALYNLTANIAGKKSAVFFPFIATFFLYILFSNWIGLIPGVGTILINEAEATRIENSIHDDELEANEPKPMKKVPLFRAPSADLNMTMALALISVSLIQFYGIKYLGPNYLGKFFNFKNPIFTFVGLLEFVGEFAKILSFAFRLFGNVFAGEVLLAVIGFLMPVIAPVPFYGLEIFVGFIQALVFSMLSLVFLNMATTHAEH